MIKKLLISLLFFTIHNNYIIAMDEITSSNTTIDYDQFFELCRIGQESAIKDFIKQNPTININYQNNHGTTPLLHAATWGNWNIVWYLLKYCNENKMMKDNYGQTLFSKAVYNWSSVHFKKLLKIYSLDEINILCKTICLDRKTNNPAKFSLEFVNTEILNALNNKKNLDEQDNDGKTILHSACIYEKVPLIIELLKHGADLDIKDNSGESCYDCLYKKGAHDRAPLFVVREAFNNGPCIPVALMQNVFEKIGNDYNHDVSHYIKQLYVEHIVKDNFKLPKAQIWKYVCNDNDACEKGGLIKSGEKADKKRCLATIMLLPQKKLTEINIQLALANK